MDTKNLEDLGFDEILQAAEQLTAEIDSTSELPRIQRNLRQVYEAGQQLLERTAKSTPIGNVETRASIFLGTKGVDITKMSQSLDPLSSPFEVKEVKPEVDIDSFIKSERAMSIRSLVESTNRKIVEQIQEKIRESLELDWKEEKNNIISSMTSLRPLELHKVIEGHVDSSILSSTELTYSHEIDNYNKAIINKLSKPNLLEKFEQAAKNSGDKGLKEMWNSIVEVLGSFSLHPTKAPIDRRTHIDTIKSFISRARKYLEKCFWGKIQNEVFINMGKIDFAGPPDAIQIVKNYLSIRGINSIPTLELGAGDVGPVWAAVYYCLRGGQYEAAAKYMKDNIGNNDMGYVLEELAKNNSQNITGLSRDLEAKIRLDYKRVLKLNNRDAFKRIVYCILGACDLQDDHPDVANHLDDYLWLKLCQLREDKEKINNDFMNYATFQSLILEKYGETHFDAFKQPYVYFQALFLTGQFEAAIEFLSRMSGMRSHAVHFALILNELSLLITSDPKESILTKVENDPPGIRRLNFSNLIVRFAKRIQATNTKEALNYLFFLRNIPVGNSNLFAASVSDLALESREFNVLFGRVDDKGYRTKGILESMGIQVSPIIEFCATESENNGMMEDAVLLYDLAGKQESALKVLIRVIALTMKQKPLPDSPRKRIQKLAIYIAERYYKEPPASVDKTTISTFYVLLDFMTFFDEYHDKKFDVALNIMSKLGIIPMKNEDLNTYVGNFHSMSDEIRMNIPELILATMDSIHEKYKKLRGDNKRESLSSYDASTINNQNLEELKESAKTLVTYCGMIPFIITGETYTKVMQLEVQMN